MPYHGAMSNTPFFEHSLRLQVNKHSYLQAFTYLRIMVIFRARILAGIIAVDVETRSVAPSAYTNHILKGLVNNILFGYRTADV